MRALFASELKLETIHYPLSTAHYPLYFTFSTLAVNSPSPS